MHPSLMHGKGIKKGIKRSLFAPSYQERIAKFCNPDHLDNNEPVDYLQLMLDYAAAHRPEEFASLDIMTRRLIIANFGAIHQPSMLIVNTLLNIVASDTEYDTISVLRDELTDVFGYAPDSLDPDIADARKWTRININKLEKADSLIYSMSQRPLIRSDSRT